MKRVKKVLRVLSKIISFLLTLLLIASVIAYAGSIYVKESFKLAQFEQIYLTMTDAGGTGVDPVIDAIKHTSIVALPILVVLLIPFIIEKLVRTKAEISLYIRKFKITLFRFPHRVGNIIKIALIIIFLMIGIENIGYKKYVENQNVRGRLYETDYVDAKDVNITFKEKRNLIYIYMESMESTFSNVSGENYISGLETLARENVNFSHNKGFGGSTFVSNTGWTIAGMVAQTSGVNMLLTIGGNKYKVGKFLPGVTSLGEILEENGYKNYLRIGSKATFAGTNHYFKNHGNYDIYDHTRAQNEGYIPSDYFVFWGFEDRKLFNLAKSELVNIAAKGEPFNYTIATIDSHYPDGYTDNTCSNKYGTKYKNAIECSANKVYEFVKWIQEQDFYENTTIVLAGDHLTMSAADYINNIPTEDRHIYNAFINPALKPEFEKNRIFSSLDMFPTTLAAIGAEIDGNRLGLGVNLFSNVKTIFEKYDVEYVNNDLAKLSEFYNENILKGDYELINK